MIDQKLNPQCPVIIGIQRSGTKSSVNFPAKFPAKILFKMFNLNFISIEFITLRIPCTLFKVADFSFYCACFCANKIQCIYTF